VAETTPASGWLIETEDLGDGMERRRYAYMDGQAREVVVPKFRWPAGSDKALADLAYSPPPGPAKTDLIR
jgi:hypothetical protein